MFPLGDPGPPEDVSPTFRLQKYKDLFYQLHVLEKFPGVIPKCRHLLFSMLTRAVQRGQIRRHADPALSILNIEKYSFEKVNAFIYDNNLRISDKWERYLQRRRDGGQLELFSNTQEARQWLKSISPVRLVDGAWLGHINGVTTPYPIRRSSKYAWQVFSEEVGDGDRAKNHVAVFQDLLDKSGISVPAPDTIDYVRNRDAPASAEVWESAVGQLLISLFPNDFMAEILGFNLQFELMTLETLKAAKELAEVGLDPYYFVLHVTIDNIDSGHGAIAVLAVDSYLQAIRATKGEEAMNQAWKRVQAGFLLSETLPTCPKKDSGYPSTLVPPSRDELEKELLPIFRSKAEVSQRVHANSRCKFGGRRLVDWLDPDHLSTKLGQQEFLDALSEAKPWVKKGDSAGSRLYQELTWGGKMFGAFTRSEAELVRLWIDSLARADEDYYREFVGDHDPDLFQSDAIPESAVIPELENCLPTSTISTTFPQSKAFSAGPVNFPYLLPLWLAHPCLLEGFVSVPIRSSSVFGCAAVRVLRAQQGFLLEGSVVDGMDEASRPGYLSLIGFGLDLAETHMGFKPQSLDEVFEAFPSQPAKDMLHLSAKPMEHRDALLGMASAFVNLHEAVWAKNLLGGEMQNDLRQIIDRERSCLQICFDQVKVDGGKLGMVHAGYALATSWTERCFQS